MTTSKGVSSISRAPSLPEVGHAAVAADPLEALGHGLGVDVVVVDDQHLGGRIENVVGRLGFGGTHGN